MMNNEKVQALVEALRHSTKMLKVLKYSLQIQAVSTGQVYDAKHIDATIEANEAALRGFGEGKWTKIGAINNQN